MFADRHRSLCGQGRSLRCIPFFSWLLFRCWTAVSDSDVKNVAAPADGLDALLRAVIKSPAYIPHALHYGIVGDECVPPDSLYQFVLWNQTASVFDKISQHFERFPSQ